MISTAVVDSSLGCWTVTQWEPDAGERLAASVLKIWLFEGTTANARERVFPDGTLEIVVQLDASYRRADVPSDPFAPLSVGGMRTTAMTIESSARFVRVLGFRLRSAGAYRLLRTSLSELTDRDYDLHDVIGAAAVELAERCHGARSAKTCVEAALWWASQRLAGGAPIDSAVAAAADRIEACGGAVAVRDLEANGRRSRSRFSASFRDQIGVGPKEFARFVRFRRALDLIAAGAFTLSDVALGSGYYDQAHMNAEFNTFAGMTPRAFRDAQRYPGSVRVADLSPPATESTADATSEKPRSTA